MFLSRARTRSLEAPKHWRIEKSKQRPHTNRPVEHRWIEREYGGEVEFGDLADCGKKKAGLDARSRLAGLTDSREETDEAAGREETAQCWL